MQTSPRNVVLQGGARGLHYSVPKHDPILPSLPVSNFAFFIRPTRGFAKPYKESVLDASSPRTQEPPTSPVMQFRHLLLPCPSSLSSSQVKLSAPYSLLPTLSLLVTRRIMGTTMVEAAANTTTAVQVIARTSFQAFVLIRASL